MLVLVIDIGNTSAKFTVFNIVNKQMCFSVRSSQPGSLIRDISEITRSYKNIQQAVISSSAGGYPDLISFLEKKFSFILEFDNLTALPFINSYKTPLTLGTDRLAAIAGANFLFPGADVLVFDAGTALTVDFVTKGEYLGGNISPGISMRYNALHHFTKKLPQLEINSEIDLLYGKTTTEAISAGVQNGISFEVESYIKKYKHSFPALQVIFTGGDIDFFKEKLSTEVKFEPDLVLWGLFEILKFNNRFHIK